MFLHMNVTIEGFVTDTETFQKYVLIICFAKYLLEEDTVFFYLTCFPNLNKVLRLSEHNPKNVKE